MAYSLNRQVWKLRYWILGGYLVPVSLLIGSAFLIGNKVEKVRFYVNAVDLSADIDEQLGQVGVNIQALSRSARGYLLDQNPISLQSFEKARTQYLEALRDLDELLVSNPKELLVSEGRQQNLEQQKQNLADLRARVQALEETDRQLVNLAQAGQVEEAIRFWRQQSERSKIEEISELLDQMQTLQHEIVLDNRKVQNDALNAVQTLIVGAALLSSVLSIGIGLWIVWSTSRKMNSSASSIASSTAEIAATVEQQERTAQIQAVSVNETTTTMDELGTSSRQSAEQAEAAAAGARQALDLADEGTKAVDRTLQGMATLREKVGAIADQILRLSEQTSQIGNISSLVSDLANQTNMLALNAAVEAVRAGEHGKGFAVVSSEIRKLADQSKQSAEKINTLVNDIQNAINSTVMATDEGTKTVEEGVRIAQETADAFAGVADAVNNVVLNSQQISLNVKQQAVAIQQVVSAMNSLNSAAQETANGISQVKVGTRQLNEAAVALKGVV